mgnify:CR=1 FL=1
MDTPDLALKEGELRSSNPRFFIKKNLIKNKNMNSTPLRNSAK